MAASPWDSLSLANAFVWVGITLCITQSAVLSGLNLAIFSISKLRLEVEVRRQPRCVRTACLAQGFELNLGYGPLR
jgi:CBS domain containing-hemolysin-like protein